MLPNSNLLIQQERTILMFACSTRLYIYAMQHSHTHTHTYNAHIKHHERMTKYIDIGWLTLAMYFSLENAIARASRMNSVYGRIHWHSGGHDWRGQMIQQIEQNDGGRKWKKWATLPTRNNATLLAEIAVFVCSLCVGCYFPRADCMPFIRLSSWSPVNWLHSIWWPLTYWWHTLNRIY